MSRTDFSTELVPMDQWGKDHWSTLGYVEAVSVENAGFQVGSDPRMKTNRRHTRVLAACPRPKRTAGFTLGVVMEPEHATRLKDGTQIPNHDDWACLQDFVGAGLFQHGAEVEPKKVLKLSERGLALTAALRAHKADGGSFATFDPMGLELPEPPRAPVKRVRKASVG